MSTVFDSALRRFIYHCVKYARIRVFAYPHKKRIYDLSKTSAAELTFGRICCHAKFMPIHQNVIGTDTFEELIWLRDSLSFCTDYRVMTYLVIF